MKIIFLSADFPPMLSGMGDYGKNLAVSLKNIGYDIRVLTSGMESADAEADLPVLRSIRSWDETAWPIIRNIVSKLSPDIFHFQYMTSTFCGQPFANFLPELLKKEFPKLRIVTTYHEFAAPLKRLLLWPILRSSDAHIVTNDRHLEMLKMMKFFLRLRGPVEKIPLAANVPVMQISEQRIRELRLEMGVGEKDFLFVRFGILHDIILPYLYKLADIFIKARAGGLPVKLLLIGKAEVKAKHAMMNKIDLSENAGVILRNDLSLEEISAYLHASNAGLGIYPDGVSEKRTALLALFAHGLPVIGTTRGKLPDEFRNGENLLTLNINAGEADWIELLSRVAGDQSLRKKLSSEARKTASGHDWSCIARQTGELYRKVLQP